MRGGERHAIARLRHFLHGTDGPAPVDVFTDQRSLASRGAAGLDDSAKLSPWLAMGALSPRVVFHEVSKCKAKITDSDAIGATASSSSEAEALDWLLTHLTIRDFFLFTGIKAGPTLFCKTGIRGTPLQHPWRGSNLHVSTKDDDQQQQQLSSDVRRWCAGKTGFPFHDACMLELSHTGWMSNRGRQNVASFLTKDLDIDWRIGAEFFELLLIDHDVAANWANWQCKHTIISSIPALDRSNHTSSLPLLVRLGTFLR